MCRGVPISQRSRQKASARRTSVPPAEGRADLMLVGMDVAPQQRQVPLDNPRHQPIRIGGCFEPVLEGAEPTLAIEHRLGL
jgi:hypothetical protein